MAVLLEVSLGIGLSAASGFRVFVPFLLMSLAARAGMLHLGGHFAWIGSNAALITFAIATAVEILAYYVPWLDHLLDSLATPAAVVAGVLITASVITSADPLWRWTLAVIAGGGAAAAVQATTVGGRGASLLFTGGLGNPLVSTLELVGSLLLSVASIVLPLAGVLLVLLVLLIVTLRLRRRARLRRSAVVAEHG